MELTWHGPFLIDGDCPDLNAGGLLDDPEPLAGPWFTTEHTADGTVLGYHLGGGASHRIDLGAGNRIRPHGA